ncbi:MAG: hypothetical protein ABW069_03970 [Duganella sp.]
MNNARSARPLRAVATIVFLALLAACSTPFSPPNILDPDTRFPGLIDLAAQAQGHEADVLLVHGICTHDARWAAQVVAQLAMQLKPSQTAPPAANAAPSAPAARQLLDAAPIEIVPSSVDTRAGRLRFNALIWSPLTTPLKRQLCYDQTDKSDICTGAPPYPYQRPRLNARFKDVLVDDCLPDALIYQGVARDQIQLRMRDAILHVLADSTAPADLPLVVIAHSMGSKILFDTLLRMTQEAPDSRAAVTARRLVDRLRFLVMAANQIPLLSLADQPLADQPLANQPLASTAPSTIATPAAPPDSLQQLLQQRRPDPDRRQDGARLTLVAFTDPGDVLSYTLPPERYAGAGVAVFNILVSNAPTWLGLLERPDRAHLDYLANPAVGRLIACGVPASALCK